MTRDALVLRKSLKCACRRLHEPSRLKSIVNAFTEGKGKEEALRSGREQKGKTRRLGHGNLRITIFKMVNILN